ncbi:hypothetical protein CF95_gp125 [Erwinia phage PhiEaH1]|uniref:Uncharacterized protein n=1 Tax=Erwinia phage PhiEaH1 TaxID=1401669 RepID=W8CZF0_9CAUD|nr:hypothetical protein CF95_gp125 [Erwinia phage PhiEaH1]AGX01847.1 hypothetical protein [Erwinia phage PhiEaH1]WBF04716.1 hypothetical protein [Erwinia phage vB_Ea277G]
MSENKIDASAIRAGMHKAVDSLIDVIESCPPDVMTGEADGEEVSFIASDVDFRDQPWFQETASEYDQNTLHKRIVSRVELNEHWSRINEETKESTLAAQKEWDEKHAADPSWNLPRPRALTIIDPVSLPGYHLLDENSDSLQELFRENLY